jgi:hypothetical protein
MSKVKLTTQLGDHCFVAAQEAIASVIESIEEDVERKPTLAELCEVLMYGLQACSDDALADVHPTSVVAIRATVKGGQRGRRRVKLTPGDLVAIPRARGGYYVVVFIAQGFGSYAVGLLDGHVRAQNLTAKWKPRRFRRHPLLTNHEPIVAGRWRVVGNRPDLIGLFLEPEQFHQKLDSYGFERIGRYGSAENAAGELRHLSRKEAEEVGVIGDELFHQAYIDEHFERFLAKKIG